MKTYSVISDKRRSVLCCALIILLFMIVRPVSSVNRQKLNFNGGWLLKVGDFTEAMNPSFDDSGWQHVTLPYAFNENEAFRVSIENLTDTVMWYRKHFTVDEVEARKYFIEFEGIRFGAEVWLNDRPLGITENGVMASGFDLTPYIKRGENVIAVRVDNDWHYKERATGTAYEWNDRNFNANYGGIPKNVFLHITGLLHQTLPLYSNLKTVGTYVYGSDYDIKGKTVLVHAETEVINEDSKPRVFRYFFTVTDAEGIKVGSFEGGHYDLQPGEKLILKAQGKLSNAHFWSWGYGYLYTVNTVLQDDNGIVVDNVPIRTGFRKTQFVNGMFYLNDRELMIHGYAQRTSNEWPGVGMSVPAWLSDYSNHLMVQSCGNLVRWMHVCPWKQDIESCDRVGLLESMPAGDAEKDAHGRQWEQRCELMRDAIIYNRNNPSIIFYEGGNKGISEEHMKQLVNIRDQYDPDGGRAIGAREMMNVPEAEYGGEMMYVNKSDTHPMWSMEYDRDEGLRKYWDNWSYPYHKEGDGPLYRGNPALEYNHNQDEFAKSMVRSWYDYFIERPGTGTRVNNGGVKIVFSDTNTHHRGESNYRTSGVVDAMRIPKDAYFVHQVLWDGWVTPEKDSSYIIGHWNYKAGVVKPVYVVSTGDEVELLLNGKSLGKGKRSKQWLFTFDRVPFAPGILEAVSYRNGKVVSRTSKETAGEPNHLKLTKIENPLGFKADGADMAILQIEVVDKEGRRCPLDNRMIHFNCWGEVQWIGGIAQRTGAGIAKTVRRGGDGLLDAANTETISDNYINSINLPVECGVNRVLIRSTVTPGDITVVAGAEGMRPVSVTLTTQKVDETSYLPEYSLKGYLTRGETPLTPSFVPINKEFFVKSVLAGSNAANAMQSCDGDETTEWKSDGKKVDAWITYTLTEDARIDQLTLKLTGWRNHIYPLLIFEGKKLVWQGNTYPTLGYVHIHIPKPVKSDRITIRMAGSSSVENIDSDTAELAGGKANSFDIARSSKDRVDLRIVEVDFLQKIKP